MMRARLLSLAGLLALGTSLALAQPPEAHDHGGAQQHDHGANLAAAAEARLESFDGFTVADRDALGEEGTAAFLDTVNTMHCPCGCAKGTLAQCRRDDPNCGVSRTLVARAMALAKSEPGIDGRTLTGRLQREVEEQQDSRRQAFEAQQQDSRRQELEAQQQVQGVPIDGAPWKGARHAKVTIVVYSEFQCPFCARVNPTLEKLLHAYPPGTIKIAFKHFPLAFHPMAGPAAEAAVEAQEQRQFWAFHDRLFEGQRQLSRESLLSWARELGMDAEKLGHALETGKHRARVAAEHLEGQQHGVSGTPAFFVNGRFLSGAQPLEVFQALVDEEIAKAERLIEDGVPMAEIYQRLTQPDAEAEAAAPPPRAGDASTLPSE
jgi:protein-disulfide isomerase